MRFLCVQYIRRNLWVRVAGRGAEIRDLRFWPQMFSERNGLVWGFRIGWLYVRWLDYCPMIWS